MRNNHGRIQGRAGVELRKRRLAMEPLCRDCADEGRVTEAQVIDHIEPLALGGLDIDSNCRALCHEHHEQRTRQQFGWRKKLRFSVDGWPEQE